VAACEPETQLNGSFSSPDASPRAWSEVVAVLSAAEIFWLSTVRRERNYRWVR
jgi:hypothetical protein